MGTTELREEIEELAEGLEQLSQELEGQGVGLHPTRGHVRVLRDMASAMRRDAAAGKTPHEYTGGMLYASDSAPGPRSEPALACARTLRKCELDASEPISIQALDSAFDKHGIATFERLQCKAELIRARRVL